VALLLPVAAKTITKTKQHKKGKQCSEKEDLYTQSSSCSKILIKSNKTTVAIGKYEGFGLQKMAKALHFPIITYPAVTHGEVILGSWTTV